VVRDCLNKRCYNKRQFLLFSIIIGGRSKHKIQYSKLHIKDTLKTEPGTTVQTNEVLIPGTTVQTNEVFIHRQQAQKIVCSIKSSYSYYSWSVMRPM